MAFYRLKVVREKLSDESPQEFSSSSKVFNTFKEEVSTYSSEHFEVLYLSSTNELLGIETLSIGTVNATAVWPRDIMRGALLSNATAIIMFHNHPSGNPNPSNEDIEITKTIIQAAKFMDIRILDHIIFGETTYYSFQAQGRI